MERGKVREERGKTKRKKKRAKNFSIKLTVRILRPGMAKPEDVDEVCLLLVLACFEFCWKRERGKANNVSFVFLSLFLDKFSLSLSPPSFSPSFSDSPPPQIYVSYQGWLNAGSLWMQKILTTLSDITSKRAAAASSSRASRSREVRLWLLLLLF